MGAILAFFLWKIAYNHQKGHCWEDEPKNIW